MNGVEHSMANLVISSILFFLILGLNIFAKIRNGRFEGEFWILLIPPTIFVIGSLLLLKYSYHVI